MTIINSSAFLKRLPSRSGNPSHQQVVALVASTAALSVAGLWLSRHFSNFSPSKAFPFVSRGQQNSKEKEPKLGLDGWIHYQKLFALTSIVAAFGPDGKNATGTSTGCMIASPSRPGSYLDPENENENYFFQWTRDGSLCLRTILRKLEEVEMGELIGLENEDFNRLDDLIKGFIIMNRKLQFLDNPSGSPWNGGLGEPKFLVNGTPFEATWGRPQNDGPAIRASTLIRYAKHLVETHTDQQAQIEGLKFIESTLYSKGDPNSFISMDINHVCETWRLPTFDLWEEVKATNGGHFYTLMVQRRAVQDMLDFVSSRPYFQPADETILHKYRNTLVEMDTRLEEFWNPEGVGKREGGPGWNSKIIEDCLRLISDQVLNKPHILPTLDRLDDVFSAVYKINSQQSKLDGIAIGRYPEDNYDGKGSSVGHPWFLCTNTVAETLYLTAHHFKKTGSITITPISLTFFQRFISDLEIPENTPLVISRGSEMFTKLVKGIKQWADTFLEDVRGYGSLGSKMSEQIHRETGMMRGARELTWSYASFLTAIDARDGKAPN
ncbi:family 15 glycoside hydrolase [Melampsora larici-populina 98AG31]|uniref:glucan 1,4-alpha-glucosidase n=1 Tax=Melampsora larici-populina (strain 98AG31 / pathotype 3-4-7) TaxID=747676 RepID=F4RKU1_MELLP|nr:family 15 glycoside hydrolase [Melampsora larici-populina 98AG31]EGG06978.1 family 15 glycoside hydrolase [Melampsora larici-populina 98AG31]